jgi:hypothetical protein
MTRPPATGYQRQSLAFCGSFLNEAANFRCVWRDIPGQGDVDARRRRGCSDVLIMVREDFICEMMLGSLSLISSNLWLQWIMHFCLSGVFISVCMENAELLDDNMNNMDDLWWWWWWYGWGEASGRRHGVGERVEWFSIQSNQTEMLVRLGALYGACLSAGLRSCTCRYEPKSSLGGVGTYLGAPLLWR